MSKWVPGWVYFLLRVLSYCLPNRECRLCIGVQCWRSAGTWDVVYSEVRRFVMCLVDVR
jgi:hypothetical protein